MARITRHQIRQSEFPRILWPKVSFHFPRVPAEQAFPFRLERLALAGVGDVAELKPVAKKGVPSPPVLLPLAAKAGCVCNPLSQSIRRPERRPRWCGEFLAKRSCPRSWLS